ncbi:MAG: type II toxin-antitoxin system HipA family toxin [Solirubrobacteraceae bacterium]|nr:type II toxin-antitoxin system HipA family toxin [Solirubrobacteraceae bacterium]
MAVGDAVTVAAVDLWGTRIGAVSQDGAGQPAVFQYDPAFMRAGIEPAPLQMPVRRQPYSFAALAPASFRGLPGMLADSLPDRFGNALIDAWLARQGRVPDSFDAVERLCYIATRGMGALEFRPSLGPAPAPGRDLQVSELVQLAAEVLEEREALHASLTGSEREDAMRDILAVGTSAGGARAKAVIAFDPRTGTVRSGQLDAPDGFDHWLLKFDGVDSQRELGDPLGYGAIEFAYANMARVAGIEMAPCRLLEEGGRRHFMMRRFDRVGNAKLHMQSLAALAHYDFTQAGAYSYEQALAVIRRLDLSHAAVEQQFRRMVFNIVARNQDDHVKNIAFLMNRDGDWALSPAYDMTYAFNPAGQWTSQHQMSVAGKRDGFTVEDLRACGRTAAMKRGAAERILAEVTEAVSDWERFAADAGVGERQLTAIARAHRLSLPSG